MIILFIHNSLSFQVDHLTELTRVRGTIESSVIYLVIISEDSEIILIETALAF